MSYCHFKLIQVYNNESFVKYRIICGDFNDSHQNENLGLIEYNKSTKEFSHVDNDLWLSHKIYPIEIMEQIPEERVKVVNSKYSDFGSGAWPLKILSFINDDLRNENFPKEKILIS